MKAIFAICAFISIVALSGWAADVSGRNSVAAGGVQLWTNGVYWAEWNVGAAKPEDGGKLYRFDAAADAVRGSFGAPWRVPTDRELLDLADRCVSQWTTSNGVVGCLFTSKSNGKSVFFPAAGCLHGENHDDVNVRACSWSSSEVSYDTNYVFYLSCSKGDVHRNWTMRRTAGATVRAVRDADGAIAKNSEK